MPVTQNYKTVTFSPDALMYVTVAVLTQLRADRREIARLPEVAFDDFLVGEIATGNAAMAFLNSHTTLSREYTHGSLEGELLQTVLEELHQWRAVLVDTTGKLGGAWLPGRLERLDNALLFLENPK